MMNKFVNRWESRFLENSDDIVLICLKCGKQLSRYQTAYNLAYKEMVDDKIECVCWQCLVYGVCKKGSEKN